jgi:DNA-binding GntR family transcriptional regulator
MSLDDVRLPPSLVGTRATQVHETLRDAIFDGTIRAGEPLREEAIAVQLSVSRTPVREALRQLELEGLARSGPGGSIVVADYTPEELEQLCMIRETLQGLAAKIAAGARTATEVTLLDDLVVEFEEAVESGDQRRVVEANNAFHEAIEAASRNSFLSHQLTLLRRMIERLDTSTLLDPERQAETLAEHREISSAIAAGDGARAEQASRVHFQKAAALRVRQAHARQREQRAAARAGTA